MAICQWKNKSPSSTLTEIKKKKELQENGLVEEKVFTVDYSIKYNFCLDLIIKELGPRTAKLALLLVNL